MIEPSRVNSNPRSVKAAPFFFLTNSLVLESVCVSPPIQALWPEQTTAYCTWFIESHTKLLTLIYCRIFPCMFAHLSLWRYCLDQQLLCSILLLTVEPDSLLIENQFSLITYPTPSEAFICIFASQQLLLQARGKNVLDFFFFYIWC